MRQRRADTSNRHRYSTQPKGKDCDARTVSLDRTVGAATECRPYKKCKYRVRSYQDERKDQHKNRVFQERHTLFVGTVQQRNAKRRRVVNEKWEKNQSSLRRGLL